MLGALVGDVVGSVYERNNRRSMEFSLFSPVGQPTDDSMMTLAICEALTKTAKRDFASLSLKTIQSMQRIGRKYRFAGYSFRFGDWLFDDYPKPYDSFGNGGAMRVSGVAYAARDLAECKNLSYLVTCITHNHPDGIKGAECVATSTFLALHGATKEEIAENIDTYYDIDFTIDEVRKTYHFTPACDGSVQYAMAAFLEAENFEEAVRKAVSIGGKSDTLAAMAGAVAGAFYGIPQDIAEKTRTYFTEDLLEVLDTFEATFPVPVKE